MRLVDADALIKETTEVRCVNCDRRKGMKKGKMTFVYEIGDVPCRACDVMDMIDVLDEAPTVATDTNVLGKWISADKRPPKQGRYLVWGLTRIAPDHYDEANGFWEIQPAFWFGKSGWDRKVKFWQMLPEPPEEVNRDAAD